MAIKRPSQDMPSFAEMRKRLSPKAEFLGRTVEEPAPTPPPAAEAAPEPTPAPAKAPVAKPAAAKPAATAGQGAPAPKPKRAAAKPSRPKPAPKAKAEPKLETATEILKGRVQYPAPGHSRKFDAAVKAYGEKEALQLFLKAALADYTAALMDGALTEALEDYPRGQGDLNVSRAMDAAAFARARDILDPMEMMGTATLAARILRNALAWRLSKR